MFSQADRFRRGARAGAKDNVAPVASWSMLDGVTVMQPILRSTELQPEDLLYREHHCHCSSTMNLFLLDLNRQLCAAGHCDKHIIKMILELAQLLYGVWALTEEDAKWREQAPKQGYRVTHKHHPVSVWLRASRQNYVFAASFSQAMLEEYTKRYHRVHGCTDHLVWLENNIPPKLEDKPMSQMPQAMPEQYRVNDGCGSMEDTVEAYRRYYVGEKMWMAKYTNSEWPQWIDKDVVELAKQGLILRKDPPKPKPKKARVTKSKSLKPRKPLTYRRRSRHAIVEDTENVKIECVTEVIVEEILREDEFDVLDTIKQIVKIEGQEKEEKKEEKRGEKRKRWARKASLPPNFCAGKKIRSRSILQKRQQPEISNDKAAEGRKQAGKLKRIEKLTHYLKKCNRTENNVINLSYFQLPNIHSIVEEVVKTNHLNTNAWTDLKLDLNGIVDVTPNLFIMSRNLTTLTLRYNKINQLPEELCANCPNLRVLNISNNPLSNGLPENIDLLVNLEELHCSNTIMKDVTPALGRCTKLVVVDFFNCNIVELSPEMGQLSQLQRLDLANNYVTTLPREFVGLKSLNYLNLNNNNIQTLPEGFATAVGDTLRELHMARTGIDDGDVVEDDDQVHNLIDDLSKMKQLSKLDISNNKISHVPGKFADLSAFPNLKRLNLSHNPLVSTKSMFETEESLLLKDRLEILVVDVNSNNVHNKMVTNEGEPLTASTGEMQRPLHKTNSKGDNTAFILGTSPSSGLSSGGAHSRKSLEVSHFKRYVLDYEDFIERDLHPVRSENSVRIPFITRLSMEELRDRIKGCIFGAALGDAIGLATEFLSKVEAQFHYHDQKLDYYTFIRDKHRSAFTPGDWTDDTDQMIVIMDCILNNNEDEEDILNKSNSPMISQHQFAAGLQKWAKTGFRDELGDSTGTGIGHNVLAVVTHPNFLDSPQAIAEMAIRKSEQGEKNQNVANNGALMRTAVLGIPFFYNMEKVVNHTRLICKTTHADDRCVSSCLALSSAIALLMRGEDLIPHASKNVKPTAPINYIIQQSLRIAKSATKDSAELEEAMGCRNFRKLRLEEENTRGYTFKTLGAAFSCFYEQARDDKSFKDIITSVIMEGGDSDSNGCSAGALIGARIGYSQLPEEWLGNLIHKEWLENKVDKFIKILGL
ncbi:hypothetical protein PROFUN_03969 [Planoprotostelium fungivorum]|uniref:Uncharacterized protein n=1 Tax=Planoprotostelium fungivorum TaxID=1890364 RepID=A0A2P6MTV5_9EUKA|nr:hypothetical protein PROFUN_03969 [Planoprotostelium fungivorum]